MAKLSKSHGKNTIVLNPEDEYPFGFGLFKAKLIVDNFDSIKAFVESGGKNVNSTIEDNSLEKKFQEGTEIEEINTGDTGVIVFRDTQGFSYDSYNNNERVYVTKENFVNFNKI